jgi:hypothetical protein
MGQRQSAIDGNAAAGRCEPFRRPQVDAVPYRSSGPTAARYGALARDGVSCTTCHRVALGAAAIAQHRDDPQNACVAERQALLNPGLKGFAATFTGSFWLAPATTLYGPYADPKKKPMQHALGITPEHQPQIRNADLCGSCHVVHLPVLRDGQVIAHTYEQTTFAEWAFSAFRTGRSTDGVLPLGPGEQAQSCQDCHMPSKNAQGHPVRSKIASIQEPPIFRRPRTSCRARRSTCACARALPSTRWSGSTCSSSRWRSSSPTSSGFARAIRCSPPRGSIRCC